MKGSREEWRFALVRFGGPFAAASGLVTRLK